MFFRVFLCFFVYSAVYASVMYINYTCLYILVIWLYVMYFYLIWGGVIFRKDSLLLHLFGSELNTCIEFHMR